MKDRVRQSMAWLHTWAGLLFGWLVFVIFACGTISYWQDEITRWMQPEITGRADPVAAIEGAAAFLQRTSPDAKNWYITPPSPRAATTEVFWEPASEVPGQVTQATLEGAKPVDARDTRGGAFFYRFHFDLYGVPYLWARYLVGVAAMFMLVAILSGIVTHKKIFVDFFLLRLGKRQRSWLDAHNVTAVVALPFHLMITYTGLVTLATLYMPWAIAANYASEDQFYADVFPGVAVVESDGRSAASAPQGPMIAAAQARWGEGGIGFVQVTAPGHVGSTVTFRQSSAAGMDARGEEIAFDGVSGRIRGEPAAKGGAAATEGVMIGLHTGRYARPVLRWLYFLSGLAGTVMVATGLVLWTVKRRAKLFDPARPHAGFRLVERLNIAVIAGFPAATAAYFLANRLLPTGLAARAEWEIRCLFLAWAAAFVLASVRSPRRAWIELLGLSALLFALVPVVNAATTQRGLIASMQRGDWLFAGFDLVMAATASILALTAQKVGRRTA
jgi:uncharacterized iron-regulated membrane protein